MRKVLGLAAVAFLVFFVVSNPDGAAHAVRHLGAGLTAVAHGFADFAGKLAG